MLTSANRWMLAGAWALILGAGALGLRSIGRIPAQDSEADRVIRTVRERMAKAPVDVLPPMKTPTPWGVVTAEPAPIAEGAIDFRPRLVAQARPRPPKEVDVMPFYATASATASLDGVALSWTSARGPVALAPNERPRETTPAAVTVARWTGDGWTELARLKPDATSWTDAGAPSGASLRYRVRLAAPDRVRATAAVGPDAEARTPSDVRARLVGGDTKVAILRVETYNRMSRTWTGKERPVRPGQPIWPGGWTLTGLKFRGFVLVAEAAVGDGRTVELTTQD